MTLDAEQQPVGCPFAQCGAASICCDLQDINVLGQPKFIVSIKQSRAFAFSNHHNILTYHLYLGPAAGSSWSLKNKKKPKLTAYKKGPEMARYRRSPFPKLGDATSNGAAL